ncbi:MAG: hypothetical protein AAFO75_07665 [Pseudomonadota bacterium]
MIDGTGRTLDAEANAAANDAARDAREEVFAKAKKSGGKSKKSGDEVSKIAKRASKSKDGWKSFLVDVWLTDFNTTEFGIYKRHRNRAKSRQFTTDMDIYAEIIEDGERTGLLGFRKDLWNENTGMDRRLVFKMFSDKLNWRATMDLMIGRSLQLTMGARGLPCAAYAINTNHDDYIIYLERSANKWPMLPEHFSFFLMRDGKPEFFRLRRALINLGGDYTLYNQRNEVIGYIDGKLLSLAGKWRGSVKADYADAKMMAAMKMFAGLIIFNRGVRWHMWRLWHDVVDGRLDPSLERHEGDLYMNPRRVR